MDVTTPSKASDRITLDKAPPSPPMKRAKTMMDNDGDEGSGLGQMASTPQAKALQGLQLAQQGVQQLALVLPNLAPQLGDFLNQLQQVTVSAVAGMTNGSAGAAPGVAPMAPPPPPAVMGNAPPPAVPGMAGGM